MTVKTVAFCDGPNCEIMAPPAGAPSTRDWMAETHVHPEEWIAVMILQGGTGQHANTVENQSYGFHSRKCLVEWTEATL